ncbi:MAG: V-type ATP synthase subunit K [Planctomycetota bacterium]
MEIGLLLAILGAASAVALGGIGSAVGVGLAGREGAGVLSEDPGKFGRLILLVALPGTQGIYGFLAWFLVMVKIGLLGGNAIALTTEQGWALFIACQPVALACLVSGIHQGKVCAAGAAMAAKKPEAAGKALIFGAMVETYAVLGLIATILILNGIKLPVA